MYSRVKGVYSENVTVEELNADLFPLHIPALVFVSLCIITGFVGNLMVLLVYKTKFRRSNHRYFILFLAALDFLACVTGMPFLVASLSLPYLMTSSALCKSMRYFHYLVNNSSGLLLLVISVERFRKICHPLKTQLNVRQTLRLCYGTIFFSAVIAIPAALLYGASTIHTGVGNITGYQCYVDDTLETPILFEIYQGVLMIETISCIVVFIFLYAFIIRKLWTSDQFIQAMRSMQSRSTSKSMHETSFSTDFDREEVACESSNSSFPTTQGESKDSGKPMVTNGDYLRRKSDLKKVYVESSSSALSVDSGNGVDCVQPSDQPKSLLRMSRELFRRKDILSKRSDLVRAQSDTRLNRAKLDNKFQTLTPTERRAVGQRLKTKQSSVDAQKPYKPKSTTARVTIMLFTVSMVFALSFIPHLALMIVTAHNEHFLENMSEGQVMVYQIFLRSFILNNVANPFVYLFCDSKFRKICKEFCRKKIFHGKSSKNG